MTLNDKIVTIIEGLNVSNTKFADTIDVSRPTISHIISGRNKPSIDIIQKIIAQYPELGYKWFLDDEELDLQKLSQLANNQDSKPINLPNDTALESSIQDNTKGRTENFKRESSKISCDSNLASPSERKVEKIIMFYNDGSMEVLSGAAKIL